VLYCSHWKERAEQPAISCGGRARAVYFLKKIMSTNGLGTPINSPSYFTSSTLHARGCGHGEYAAFLLVLPSLPCFTILARLPTPYPSLHLAMAAVKRPASGGSRRLASRVVVVWHPALRGSGDGSLVPKTLQGGSTQPGSVWSD
jgi:hypothetical protein